MQQALRQEAPSVIVIGLGNEFRSDDGAGLAVARKLSDRTLNAVSVIEENGDCTNLVETFTLAPSIIIVDAMSSGIEPGTVLTFDLLLDEIPARYFQNSLHAFGVLEAVRLARNLGSLPAHLKLYGIEGEHFEPGVGLSARVARAVENILPRIIGECNRLSGANITACTS